MTHIDPIEIAIVHIPLCSILFCCCFLSTIYHPTKTS